MLRPLYPSDSKTFKDSGVTTCHILKDNQSKSVQIIPWYGELKAENIPGIVEGGGYHIPPPGSTKNIPERIFHHDPPRKGSTWNNYLRYPPKGPWPAVGRKP